MKSAFLQARGAPGSKHVRVVGFWPLDGHIQSKAWLGLKSVVIDLMGRLEFILIDIWLILDIPDICFQHRKV